MFLTVEKIVIYWGGNELLVGGGGGGDKNLVRGGIFPGGMGNEQIFG